MINKVKNLKLKKITVIKRPIRRARKISVVGKNESAVVIRISRVKKRKPLFYNASHWLKGFVGKQMFSGFHFFVILTVAVFLGALTLSAFESHILNVTARLAQIDPPVLTPPGDIGWDNTDGGTNLTGVVNVVMTDADLDATHIFYTFGVGLDPLTVPTPVCGQTGPDGGGDIKTELIQLSLTSDTVIKAIACDGDGLILPVHNSLVNTKIYDFIDFACVPQIVSFPENLAVLAAGPGNSSSGDIFISANTDINGDARSNDDINANGSSANRFINGNATAGDDVEDANFTISGTITEGASLTTLPDINIPLWEDKADDGGTVNGSLIFPNSTTGIELGPTEVMGNVTFDGSNTATIKGPIHIHGNLVIEQNTTITQDASFGNQFVAIIVDGTIDIDNNVEFIGNGSGDGSGAFLLVSKAGPQSGDNAAIEVSNDSSSLGDVVLYADNGDVHINSNRTVLAVFAKLGTSASEPAIDFDSNVTVDFRELSTTISCGPVFTPISQLLLNEFLPNPAGSDTGTTGDPLDGEFVELYNGAGWTIDVDGYVLYDDFSPTGAATTKVWTSTADFTPGVVGNTTVTSNTVQLSSGQTSGTFEMVLDTGQGNRGDWQNLTWGENLGATGDICVDVATSNDGVTYEAFSSQDCASPFSLTSISDSRFLKWRTTHSRTNTAHSATLNDLTVSYNLYNYHELVISSTNTNTGSTLIASGDLLVVYRDGDTDFDLDNDGTDTVKLYTDHVWLGGTLIDSRVYNYGESVPDDKSFTRMPDGTANWIDPDPTPGEPNDEYIDSSTAPTKQTAFDSEPVLAEGEVEEVIVIEEPMVAGVSIEEVETTTESEPATPTPEPTIDNPEPTTNSTPIPTPSISDTPESSPTPAETLIPTPVPTPIPEPSNTPIPEPTPSEAPIPSIEPSPSISPAESQPVS